MQKLKKKRKQQKIPSSYIPLKNLQFKPNESYMRGASVKTLSFLDRVKIMSMLSGKGIAYTLN